jgi:tubulin polyglutamylase TTLL5
MQLPDDRVWRKIPGQTADEGCSDSDDEDEVKERRARARQGLEEIAAVLGDRWVDVPTIEFTPVQPGYSADCLPQRVPPSQWGVQGPPLSFRLEHVRAPVVRDTLIANGLSQTRGKEWLVMWSGPRMREKEYQGLHELQRVNHFPGSTELTRKDRICVHFERMARRFGNTGFNFLPETYVLPRQMEEFLGVHEDAGDAVWIVKPNASSQGKGIYLLKDVVDLPDTEHDITVVSRYIDKPLLIQGLKFDIRVYVLVTSFEPLRCYIYREGLIRFASSPYSTEDKHLKDAYRHLTNYSINKKAENFVENKKAHQDNVGHKWSFSAFNKHMKHVGADVPIIWARIMDLILKTLISVKPVIAAETRKATAHSANCFELYGFDVLVDEELKPWLIEVNLSPSMLAESPLDQQVKSAVLSDTFNIIGVANASWRTLATAKLRSQLIQMRHSMAMVGQAAESFRKPKGPDDDPLSLAELDAEDRATRLSELSERDLKMMAQALKEVRSENNFIQLYPTKTTVARYAPLLRSPSPTSRLLLQLLLGEGGNLPSSIDADEPPRFW